MTRFNLEDKKDRKQRSKQYAKETQRIMDTISHLHWPAGSDADLEECVNHSLIKYNNFRKKWLEARPKLLKWDHSLVTYLDTVFLTPIDFVRAWFLEVQEEISHWKNWKGPLTKFEFRSDSERFWRWGREWCYDYCCNSKRFDRLMEIFSNAG